MGRTGLCYWLYGVMALIALVHIVVLFIYFWINDKDRFDFIRLVDMDYEANIPTLFNAVLFFISAGLLWLISRLHLSTSDNVDAKSARYWLFLGLIFIFLGIDEGVKIHEYVGDYMERYIEASALLYFPWVIPYVAVMIVVGLFYLPFFLELDLQTQKGFVMSACLFLSGAVLLDMLGGYEADQNGTNTIKYSVLYTIEEILEMIGLIFFIDTLLAYLSRKKLVLILQ